jgi:hypothetical protein
MPGTELFIARDFPPEKDRLLAFNPRGTRLAVFCQDTDHVQVLDTRSGEEVARCTDFVRISSIVFLSAEVLLVAAYGGCFRCNLRRGGRELLSPEGWQTSATVHQDGRVLAIGVRGGLVLYDLVKRKVRHRVCTAFDPDYVGDRVAFSAGGRYLAADLSARWRGMGIVVIWDAQTLRRQRVFDTLADALAFREDTLALAVSSDSGCIELYEPDQGEEPATRFFFDYSLPGTMEFRDKGQKLAVLMSGGEFIQLATSTGSMERRLSPPANYKLDSAVSCADWSLFAGATDNGVVIWPGDRAEPV